MWITPAVNSFCLLLSLRSLAGDAQWQNLISCLLSDCLCAADIVAPVVTSSSPEGFMMDDNEGTYLICTSKNFLSVQNCYSQRTCDSKWQGGVMDLPPLLTFMHLWHLIPQPCCLSYLLYITFFLLHQYHLNALSYLPLACLIWIMKTISTETFEALGHKYPMVIFVREGDILVDIYEEHTEDILWGLLTKPDPNPSPLMRPFKPPTPPRRKKDPNHPHYLE